MHACDLSSDLHRNLFWPHRDAFQSNAARIIQRLVQPALSCMRDEHRCVAVVPQTALTPLSVRTFSYGGDAADTQIALNR